MDPECHRFFHELSLTLQRNIDMTQLTNDTICAISTPPGVGGIAVIRISGPQAIEIAKRIWSGTPLTQAKARTLHTGMITDPANNGEMLDQAVAAIFHAPASFTGEDTVELSVHGSRYVQQRLLEILCDNGCRLALPGEFTRRAFANGKIDLAQAEAIADVIASESRAAHRLAASQMKGQFSARLNRLRDKLLEIASLLELELDFSEEEVEFASRSRLTALAQDLHSELTRLADSFAAGNAIKQGIPVAIIGPTNAGKSSLLNLILGQQRAIVSDIHGTTRDTIEDTLAIGDYTFRFIDTAGLRHTDDPIENLGIKRTRQAAANAAITLLVVDATRPLPSPADLALPADSDTDSDSNADAGSHTAEDTRPVILLLNKTDLPGAITTLPTPLPYRATDIIPFSAHTGEGHDTLLQQLKKHAKALSGDNTQDTILVTNLRHAQALQAAAETTAALLAGLSANIPGDLLAQDLRATIHHLSTITGTLTTPDILTTIFSRFCIGK
jgi:tRNA modification GTPase trmE